MAFEFSIDVFLKECGQNFARSWNDGSKDFKTLAALCFNGRFLQKTSL
jgi:hypothetical protein